MSDDGPDPDALEHVTEASISAGRKVQLERYEPINEQATLTVEFPEGLSGEEKAAILEDVTDAAWDECERGVMQRYEAHVREDTLGE